MLFWVARSGRFEGLTLRQLVWLQNHQNLEQQRNYGVGAIV